MDENKKEEKFIQFVGMSIKCLGKGCRSCPYMHLVVEKDANGGENYIYCDHYEACANELLTGIPLMRD